MRRGNRTEQLARFDRPRRSREETMNKGNLYASDSKRWRAVKERDEHADGHFYYVVRTTGVYSKPSCVARSARRENILFFSTAEEARAAGYRPCRRCRPDEPDLHEHYASAVTKACRVIDESVEPPSLDELARTVGFSRFHFHRVFKGLTGITPHAYLSAIRACRVRRELSRTATVSDAIYGSGFNSNGHFYAASTEILGMTPTSFRAGGRGQVLRVALGESSLGRVLVAVADKGVCAVFVGEDRDALRRRLGRLFPAAKVVDPDPSLEPVVTEALDRAEPPPLGRALLPSEVQRVVLRQRMRQALRDALEVAVPCRAS
jgi:AraC family transcriptional regulator, regulatory protein of adaptative response / methylated-DNA-[protein]-cysteine methyltransferase